MPKSLEQTIENDFNYYQTKDRNQFFKLNEANSDLLDVPDRIKREITVNYLFKDILSTFRRFFDYTLCSQNKSQNIELLFEIT